MARTALSLATVILVLAGCATPGVPTTLTAEQEKTARATVLAMLKDPASAQFGGIYGARKPDGTIYVCGMVNARNGFGGYAGAAPFTGYFESDRSPFTLNEIGTSDSYGAAMIHGCRSRGIAM